MTARARVAVDAPALGIDGLLKDPSIRIIVCTGAGGVGKTTTAAAVGLRAAEHGRHVCVLTIDILIADLFFMWVDPRYRRWWRWSVVLV